MRIKQILDTEVKYMLQIKAVRNNSTFEKQCQDHKEWALTANYLLDSGFMVHIDDTTFSVLDSKGEVKFVKDVELTKQVGQ